MFEKNAEIFLFSAFFMIRPNLFKRNGITGFFYIKNESLFQLKDDMKPKKFGWFNIIKEALLDWNKARYCIGLFHLASV